MSLGERGLRNSCYERLYELWLELKVWHVMLTLVSVKVTRGYVK
jgi:hypothetical protein